MEDNCFTILGWFLPYKDEYTYPSRLDWLDLGKIVKNHKIWYKNFAFSDLAHFIQTFKPLNVTNLYKTLLLNLLTYPSLGGDHEHKYLCEYECLSLDLLVEI